MRKIVIRNISDADEAFICLLAFQAIKRKDEKFCYDDIQLIRLQDNEELVEYKAINCYG